MDNDFIVLNQGSVWTFEPVTNAAKEFVKTELPLEGWQWVGNAFGIDARIADRLANELSDEGFVLEIN